MSNWIERLKNKLNKNAIEKLPDEELNQNTLNPENYEDNSQEEISPMTPPNKDALVWNNYYNVKAGDVEFIVELTPNIVGQEDVASVTSENPSNQSVTNPNANPALLDDWLKSSDAPTKPYEHNEQGTIDPLSKEDEKNPSVKVHKQANMHVIAEDYQESSGQSEVEVQPGANKSNPYPPCKYCANYIAETGECTQGLDVEKVQAAKSCSWLNANSSPFGEPKDPDNTHKDMEIFNSDPSNNTSGNNEMQQNIMNRASLRDYFKNIWD